VASLWLDACGLGIPSHNTLKCFEACQKISGNSSRMHLAAGHGPPGTMAAGRCD